MGFDASRHRGRYRMMLAVALVALITLTGCTLRTSSSDEASSGDDVEAVEISGAAVVNIVAPASNASYASNATINVQAAVSNAGSDIDRVEIMLDGGIVQSISAPNPSGRAQFGVGHALAAPAMGEHTLTVTAYRSDNSASNPASASFTVVDASSVTIQRSEQQIQPTATPESNTSTDQPTTAPQPTTPPQPTDTPEPTEIPASPTPSVPTARATQTINLRSGPGLVFDPPVGAFVEGSEAQILSFNSDGNWIHIRLSSGSEGWVYVPLVEIGGDTSGLPRVVGPPTPIQATATPIPSATPSVTNNLVPINPFLDPPQPRCGEQFRAGITIRNDGSANMSTGVTRIEVRHVASGQVIGSSGDALVPVNLPPGGSHTVAFTFNISVYYGEEQRVVFIADANNAVGETIENDNQTGITYTLERAGC